MFSWHAYMGVVAGQSTNFTGPHVCATAVKHLLIWKIFEDGMWKFLEIRRCIYSTRTLQCMKLPFFLQERKGLPLRSLFNASYSVLNSTWMLNTLYLSKKEVVPCLKCPPVNPQGKGSLNSMNRWCVANAAVNAGIKETDHKFRRWSCS